VPVGDGDAVETSVGTAVGVREGLAVAVAVAGRLAGRKEASSTKITALMSETGRSITRTAAERAPGGAWIAPVVR
jgi:hypothetical protein